MIRWLYALAGLALLAAAGFAAEPAKADYERQSDVIYGRKHGLAMTMDVFTPKGPKNGAAIIVVVSGGWHSNHSDIEAGLPLADELMKRGYVCFAVVHGSQPKFSIPECIDDIHRSVRYIRHNAKEFGIDPERIGITGASAGCHLSLVIGVAPREGNPKAKDPVERESSKVQAVGGFFPPTDFFNYGAEGRSAEGLVRAGPFSPAFDFRERDRLNNWQPVSEAKRKEIMRQISPVYHVTPQTPPTLLIHGDKDILVPLQQSRIMIEKLKENNVPCELIVHEGGGHGSWKGIENDLAKLLDWFDKYLAKK